VAWEIIMITLLMLALNRYFGLLHRLLNQLRLRARGSGWYFTHRRPIQAVASLILGVCMIAGPVELYRISGGDGVPIASIAMAGLICFIFLRAVSLHEFDQFIYRKNKYLAGGRPNLVVEWCCILIIASAALGASR
jgi:hypothetical protein